MLIQISNHLESDLIKESIFAIGKVISVDGRIVRIKVNKNKNVSHLIYDGKIVKNVSVGGYVKIVKGFVSIIGKVEGEYVDEEKYFNHDYSKEEIKINRILQVSLFGHFDKDGFKQGVKEMPLIDNECFILDLDEFNNLHQFYSKGSKIIEIGSLSDEPSQKICLSINKLFASHIGIFGNTGSGKSNTLAKIYTELFKLFESSLNFKNKTKFVLIDFNGEYAENEIITKNKIVYKLSTRKAKGDVYKISKEAFNSIEILSVLLEATEKTQVPFLSRVLNNKFLDKNTTYNKRVTSSIEYICKDILIKKNKTIGVNIFLELFKDLMGMVSLRTDDKNPIQSLSHTIESKLHCRSDNGSYYWDNSGSNVFDNNGSLYTIYIKTEIDLMVFKMDEISRLKLKLILNYYFEILKGFSNPEHIRPLIGRMFKKFNILEKIIEIVENVVVSENKDENLKIVSLKDVNLEMKKVIPLVICKQIYDNKKEDLDRTKSLHIIIDEAHNILSAISQRESETWKDYRLETFEEIIKEGRKFGTFLTIASQRPYDISSTIISQLHNYFIHRLINNNDIQAIEKTVAYLDKLSFQSIPILAVGSCFIAGLASDIPVKVDVKLLNENERPVSETVNLEESWK